MAAVKPIETRRARRERNARQARRAREDAPAPPAEPRPKPSQDPDSAFSTSPWYRRGPAATGIIATYLFSVFLWALEPLMAIINFAAWLGVVTICVVVLTGPMYYDRYGPDGEVATWRPGNRIAAVLFLAVSAALIVWAIAS